MQENNSIRKSTKKELDTPCYDAVIIGGGVVGSLISYQLSKYDISVCLLEKEADLAMEETSANSAIVHAGYDPEPLSNKAKYNILGNARMESLCQALDVPFQRNGSLVLAFSPEDKEQLLLLLERGKTNGVPGLQILSAEEVHQIEPFVSTDVQCALYAPSGGIICPYELTLAASEVAYRNGVEYFFEHEVTGIRPLLPSGNASDLDPARYEVECSVPEPFVPGEKEDAAIASAAGWKPSFKKILIHCRFIINAAGAYSDKISAMAGDDSFTILPRRGEYIVLDKTIPNKVTHTIFQTPSAKGKGVLVTPTVDGNILVGPNSQTIGDPSDNRTTEEGLKEVMALALKSVPSLDKKWMIRSFAGIRSTPSTHDFIVEESPRAKGLFQAAGIESPGLTSAPAIALEIERLVTGAFSFPPQVKESYAFQREKTRRFREMTREEQQEKIKDNPLYAQLVCRCEQVTEAEVIESIRRPLGAKTVNGIKLRTRAGMGRCQSGFCLPRILAILTRETGIPEESLTLFGTGSEILKGKTRYDKF